MSIKSFIQIIILGLIISIIIGVYYKYFQSNENIVEEINSSEIYNQEQLKILEKKVLELEMKKGKDRINIVRNSVSNIEKEMEKLELLKDYKEE